MILLRTTKFSGHTAAFAERLARETGYRVCCSVDETNGVIDVGDFAKVSLTRKSCEAVGLYCPHDFGWRCGDYGFYLARLAYPEEKMIWQIEYDVRFAGTSVDSFFSCFKDADKVDLIAGYLRQADDHWFWTHAMAALGNEVWRCLFPVVRLSADAIDLLFQMRLEYAKRPVRRVGWPNDESFVATILKRAGMHCVDLNDFSVKLYGSDTFSFDQPFDGYKLNERERPLGVYHPVLFDEDLERKIARMAIIERGEPTAQKVRRRVIHALNRRMSP